MSAWTPIGIVAATPPRGGGTQAERTITAQSIQITTAWGASPGSAIITYIGTAVPVTTGAHLTVTAGAHTFYGICRSDTLVNASRGLTRTLEFVDFREYLAWDFVFGCFNKVETRLVDGQRVRRYWHIYPADWQAVRKTFTSIPLSAAEILDAVFGADTVLTAWVRAYHEDQYVSPVFDVDCMSGKTLAAVVQELADKQGLVFTLGGGPYRLVWSRKGVGLLPGFPVTSDDRRTGTSLSGNPTRVRVIGDRNVYQIMNVELVPDWVPAWESFLILDVFEDDIFRRGSDPATGRRFNALPGDAEQYVGRQLAAYYAKTITVRAYVALRNAVRLAPEPVNDGDRFLDYRKFHGRSRLDMPAALYIKTLLFRAFKPNLDEFTNAYGRVVPMDSVNIADRLLQAVTHLPTTGQMAVVPSEPADGNGYAVVKGYQVGRDLFRTLRPEQFSVDFFKNAKAFWQSASFQWDDSGDERFVIFDDPVVVSEDLLTVVDGHAVIRADFTLVVPQARISMVVEAERYTYVLGTPGRDAVETVGGLAGEFILDGTALTEIPYDDGLFADQKGFDIADVLRQQQFFYAAGSYVVKGTNGTQLTSMIDRVSVSVNPNGTLETVDFTNERRPPVEPGARDMDRRFREQQLLPGQAELRQEANANALLAKGLRQSPGFVRFLSDFLSGTVDGEGKLFEGVMVKGGGQPLPAGSVLKRPPATVAAGAGLNTNTLAVMPAAATATDSIFAGVVLRQNEQTGRPFRVQTGGIALVRVQGPIEPNDPVGLAATPTTDYLVKNGTTAVGLAHGRISDGSVKLIHVRIGAGAGGSVDVQRFKLVSVSGDYLSCQKVSELGIVTDATTVLIAKPFHLRRSTYQSTTVNGFGITVSADGSTRTWVQGNATIVDRVEPAYDVNQPIYGTQPTGRSEVEVNGNRLVWLDINVDARIYQMAQVQVAVCINNDNNWRMFVRGSAPFRP
jgi:hypothetical protein